MSGFAIEDLLTLLAVLITALYPKGIWNILVSLPPRIKGKWFADPNMFKVTSRVYSETEDLTQAIEDEFGPNYKLADWEDIRVAYSGNIQKWTYSIGLKKGEDYFVSKNGKDFVKGTQRHYLITRFDHEKIDNYFVHDHLDNYFITLGSFNDIDRRAIAIKTKEASAE